MTNDDDNNDESSDEEYEYWADRPYVHWRYSPYLNMFQRLLRRDDINMMTMDAFERKTWEQIHTWYHNKLQRDPGYDDMVYERCHRRQLP